MSSPGSPAFCAVCRQYRLSLGEVAPLWQPRFFSQAESLAILDAAQPIPCQAVGCSVSVVLLLGVVEGATRAGKCFESVARSWLIARTRSQMRSVR